MYLGYNTNGLAHHDLFDAVELLAEIGYRGVAITIDHNALPPRSHEPIMRLRRLLERLGMRSVIETGARFLLDPRVKHEPTLLSENRRQRIDFYHYAIRCAAELGSDCVSLWSGALASPLECGDSSPLFPRVATSHRISDRTTESGDESPHSKGRMASLAVPAAMDRLVDGLREVLDYAAASNVPIGFEPEPGMLIDSMRAFEELLHHMEPGGADIPVCPGGLTAQGRQECLPHRAATLRLTLDIGHLHCQGETPIEDVIRHWAPRLVNMHIEDMRAGHHEHLMFGEGEIDFPPVLRTLAEVGYTGGVYVELSRHSHEGPTAARRAFEFLTRMMNDE